jgi:hypothetical protein
VLAACWSSVPAHARVTNPPARVKKRAAHTCRKDTLIACFLDFLSMVSLLASLNVLKTVSSQSVCVICLGTTWGAAPTMHLFLASPF